LKDGVGELGRLAEELYCFGSVGCYQLFHLREDVEELGGWEDVQGAGNGVGTGETRGELDTSR